MKLGQKVQWKSQAGGSQTVKVGTIVKILTQKDTPAYLTGREKFPNHLLMFDGYKLPGGKKTEKAYFIEVIVEPKAMPRLYMPHPENLVKI